MNNPNLFPLNLDALLNQARIWVCKYPFIQNLFLYPGREPFSRYILVAEHKPEPEPICLEFTPGNVPPLSIENYEIETLEAQDQILTEYIQNENLSADEIQELKGKRRELQPKLEMQKEWRKFWDDWTNPLLVLQGLEDPFLYRGEPPLSPISLLDDNWPWHLYIKAPNKGLPTDVIAPNTERWTLCSPEPPKSSRRITINELHDIIWDVYLALKEKNSREPTSGEVWLELKRDYDRDYRIREYDTEEVIQEIKKGTIYWNDFKGSELSLKKSSFKITLCRIKKKRKNSN